MLGYRRSVTLRNIDEQIRACYPKKTFRVASCVVEQFTDILSYQLPHYEVEAHCPDDIIIMGGFCSHNSLGSAVI